MHSLRKTVIAVPGIRSLLSLDVLISAGSLLSSYAGSPAAVTDPLYLGRGAHPDICIEQSGAMHVAWMNGTSINYKYYNGYSCQLTETVPTGELATTGCIKVEAGSIQLRFRTPPSRQSDPTSLSGAMMCSM